jgi:serralysin
VATTVLGGGNYNLTVFGNGTVTAGNGNDSIIVTGKGNVTVGNGKDTVLVVGNATVNAGSGNDSITALANGNILIGGGNDSVTLLGSGGIVETSFSGHDTINLGSGNDTIVELGKATVNGAFGSVTVSGGVLTTAQLNDGTHQVTALLGNATLAGGFGPSELVGGLGNDTFVGGTGSDTMVGGFGTNLFEFLSGSGNAGGHHVINNFVSGQDQLYIEGQSLSYLQSQGDVTSHGGSTYISLSDGTTIQLKGVAHLNSSDVTTHK